MEYFFEAVLYVTFFGTRHLLNTAQVFWCERDLITNNFKRAAPIGRMTVTELNKGSQHIHLAILC